MHKERQVVGYLSMQESDGSQTDEKMLVFYKMWVWDTNGLQLSGAVFPLLI